jgi:hypothetical protein
MACGSQTTTLSSSSAELRRHRRRRRCHRLRWRWKQKLWRRRSHHHRRHHRSRRSQNPRRRRRRSRSRSRHPRLSRSACLFVRALLSVSVSAFPSGAMTKTCVVVRRQGAAHAAKATATHGSVEPLVRRRRVPSVVGDRSAAVTFAFHSHRSPGYAVAARSTCPAAAMTRTRIAAHARSSSTWFAPSGRLPSPWRRERRIHIDCCTRSRG